MDVTLSVGELLNLREVLLKTPVLSADEEGVVLDALDELDALLPPRPTQGLLERKTISIGREVASMACIAYMRLRDRGAVTGEAARTMRAVLRIMRRIAAGGEESATAEA